MSENKSEFAGIMAEVQERSKTTEAEVSLEATRAEILDEFDFFDEL
jgi:hypothetical protein